MNKYEKGELVKKILLIAVGVGAVATVIVLPGLGILFKQLEANDYRERARVRDALKRLEKRADIRRRIVKGVEEFILTDKGKQRLLKLVVTELYIPKPTKWDGRWRVLVYDIPDKMDIERRELNRVVSEMGMQALQRSVFISPYPCREQIDIVVTFYRLQKYISYFEADHYEGSDNLMLDFGLKPTR